MNANAMHPRTFAIQISAKENKRKENKYISDIIELGKTSFASSL